ncbi:hypothetical protein ABZ215_24625 [Amycolatopsis sp. NPDC006131]|uniref:hypothetical protein n=1 Tax=Amycolatopsis sp. NPDC006131 TaxID=3156731 RepID=UPI0033A43E22
MIPVLWFVLPLAALPVHAVVWFRYGVRVGRRRTEEAHDARWARFLTSLRDEFEGADDV